MTIKDKLTGRFTILAGSIFLVFTATIFFIINSYLVSDFNLRLKERLNFTGQLLIKNGLLDKAFINSIDNDALNALLDEQIIILSSNDSVWFNTFRNKQFPFNQLFLDSIKPGVLLTQTNGKTVWCGTVIISNGNPFKLATEAPLDYATDLEWFLIILVSASLVSILILFFAGRIFAANALKSVTKTINQVNEITHSNLHKRVEEGSENDELSQMARTFNQLLERLETAFELQKNFVSNASHELRTPLSSITAQLEVTLMHNRSVEEYKIVMQSVLEDIRNLNQLSEGLFDLTLASRDISLMKFTNVRVDELLMQAHSELVKRKPEYIVHIHIGELPDDEKQLIIFGKEHLLISTFRNLMDNACKFSSNKTVDVYLEVSEGTISIRFSDKGIGMSEHFLKDIFTPLLRAENAKRFPGHGLGLALSKKIVELHHGKITVSSQENNGTTISILLFT